MSFTAKYKFRLVLLFIVSIFYLEGRAQSNMVFYSIENQFNSASFNPAFLNSESQFTFSMFPLAGMNIGYNNQKVITELGSKLLNGINQDEDYLQIVRKMVDRSSFNQKLESDLLHFIYRSPEGFFDFRVRENISFSASIKGPVSGFMIKPEVRSLAIGQIQHVPVLILHYREYSFGYSSPARYRDLTWGIRGKLYYGKGVFSSDISGSVDRVGDGYFFKTKGYGKMSMPGEKNGTLNFTSSSVFDYLLNSENSGFGLDFGLKYKINTKLSASVSILDIGNINWKSNLTSKDFNSESLLERSRFTSAYKDGTEIITKNADSIAFDDKFTHLFKIDKNQLPFKTNLPTTFYAGLNYQINSKVKLNFVDRFIKANDLKHNSIMLSANFELNKGVTLAAGYSIIGNAYANLPVAFLLERNFGQFYVGTDNLWSFVVPSVSEFSGLTFGACFYLFRKRDLYDNPNEETPFFRPKKVKKVMNNGRIQKEYSDFGFPEQY